MSTSIRANVLEVFQSGPFRCVLVQSHNFSKGITSQQIYQRDCAVLTKDHRTLLTLLLAHELLCRAMYI